MSRNKKAAEIQPQSIGVAGEIPALLTASEGAQIQIEPPNLSESAPVRIDMNRPMSLEEFNRMTAVDSPFLACNF